MPTLDYIRIVGISESYSAPAEASHVTFNIEYSQDSSFDNTKRGSITLRLSDYVKSGTENMTAQDIASHLLRQVLVREKDEDGTVKINHLLGLSLEAWIEKKVQG